MAPEYPSPEWFSDKINRHQWMWNLNARFVSQAAKRMTDTDALVLLNEAVNLEIAETAANLLREGVPEKIVADFVMAYSQTQRAELLDNVCDYAWRISAPVAATKHEAMKT
ncbi:hypothetical protein FOH24_02465 [Acetobacter tropicalis]|uniref:Uncharacterized protein n=3 Tax=Acetobacteraceae TaxID=433 RepID=Q5HXH9_GLUOX|nr:MULTISPECIES: hypothetical protein [Acetobacteraceae]KAA8387241.1 hypothetical protein FOH22_10180 [Acetobacter tropicalis]AAW59774.1 hypothetical protein GOX2710 [Gluconobacter oxydans 621H]KAA8392665.1 hypothetical protein FOH24_02465 [Acetobacter tropicalis]KXV02532.1 hypothetical protein AD928_00805 [Acetobacter cerevisiae]KXV74439.1 hypothetical protein AD953_11590 [Acetobacter malorum]